MADSEKTTRGLYCDTCRGPCKIPAWITNAGGPNYQNNDAKQHLAIVRAHLPVTTPAERAQAKRNTASRATDAARCVPTRRGYGVTIPEEATWLATHCRSGRSDDGTIGGTIRDSRRLSSTTRKSARGRAGA